MDFHGFDACGVGVVAQVYLVGSDDQLLLAKQMINEIVQGADQARTPYHPTPCALGLPGARLSDRAATPFPRPFRPIYGLMIQYGNIVWHELSG